MRQTAVFLRNEDGGVIQWLLVVIAGALLAAGAYAKFKTAPGTLGDSITSAGQTAAGAVTTEMTPP
ncbi:MAG: hypothetical protein QME76_07150 [Bacillota bacterium]|nr:hypothetical protein [Bacillota bacterium]